MRLVKGLMQVFVVVAMITTTHNKIEKYTCMVIKQRFTAGRLLITYQSVSSTHKPRTAVNSSLYRHHRCRRHRRSFTCARDNNLNISENDDMIKFRNKKSFGSSGR